VFAALIACGGDSTKVEPPVAQPSGSAVAAVAIDAAAAPIDAAPIDAPAPAAAPAGADMLPYVKHLYDVVACGLDGKLPDDMAKADTTGKVAAIIKAHCDDLRPFIAKFRTNYFEHAREWFAQHEPKDLPKQVVYYFGGGDLIMALVPFPDATEFTTISLELAGDPRHLTELDPATLKDSLHAWRVEIGPAINVGMNSSINLSDAQRNVIAAQLSSHLLGLVTAGYELVGARYFTIDDDGAIHYVEQAQIDSDLKKGKSLRGNWKSPSFAQSFSNVEIQFKKPGESIVRTHRHIAWNLDNDGLKAKPGLLKFLDGKGKTAVVVKGAVYLLWQSDFKAMREFILGHLAWMVSDSTGVPPNYAEPAGMVQEAYGTFDLALLGQARGKREEAAMRKLFAKPAGPAPFRFGYLDGAGHSHLVITYPK
jgi:hypothetical protein